MRRAMPLKNGNTVAVERRVDLASLFCMIGRHGPAVALTVIAMVSVLAGLVIYRTVRGKRRKAAAAAAAADDGDGGSPVGAEGDASVMRERHRSAESTDVKDEGSSDVKEDVDLSLSDLRIRHRRAAAEKTPAPYSPPEITRVPGIERTHAEEANQSPRSDTCMAEMALVDAVDCHPFESGDAIKGASEDFRDSCLKEPETINADNHELVEEVSGAECQEDEGVTLEEDVLEETPRREDNFQCVLNDLVCFQQTSNMSDDDGLRDNKTTISVGSNSEEPLIHTEDVPVPWVYYGKDEEFERENSDGIDFCSFSGNARLSPEGESRNKNEETEEHRLDHQLIGQPVEIQTSTFQRQSNLPSVTDEGTPPVRDSDWVEDGGPAGEGVVREDHFNQLDAPSAQFDEQGVETEQKGGNGLACDQEVVVLYDGADQVTEKMPTGGNAVACREERDGSSVVLSPALTCLSTTVKTGNLDGGLSRTAGIAELADLSLDRQPTQEEDDTVPSLDEDPNSNILGPQMPSYETANRPENIRDDTTVVVVEEHIDQVLHHHVLSRHEDKQSIQTISNAAFDQASAPADPDTVANIPSVIVEDICCPHLQSICQDQQVDHVENNEETRVDSASDAAACNNTSCTAFLMSKQLSRPDTRSSSQEQSDQTKNHHEDFSIMVEVMNPPLCQIDLLSFEQFALMDYDISCAGVGEESGISSMAVSPDAINKYDVIFENTVLPMMDCDLKYEEQTEAQTSLFADDADISVIEEDTAGMVFGPSHCSQPPRSECAASTINESFASSQDMFGHEIENSYHRALDQFATQIADSVTCFAVKQFDMHVNESKEDKKEGSVEMKEATKAEKEKEEDYKKTEISIMEATMDHNEWIMDSNYQAFPWMNLSASSFTPDDTKSNHPSFEECQYSSAVVDATCTDTTDIPPSAEVKQNDTLSLVDENTGYIKSAVVVQPMAQNVDVTFRVHYFTQSPYQTVAVTGNQQELGNWKGFVLLEKAKDGHWATVVRLPAESHVEWKFVVVDKGEVCRWEECGNRLLHTGSGDELLVHKCWARL